MAFSCNRSESKIKLTWLDAFGALYQSNNTRNSISYWRKLEEQNSLFILTFTFDPYLLLTFNFHLSLWVSLSELSKFQSLDEFLQCSNSTLNWETAKSLTWNSTGFNYLLLRSSPQMRQISRSDCYQKTSSSLKKQIKFNKKGKQVKTNQHFDVMCLNDGWYFWKCQEKILLDMLSESNLSVKLMN